MLQRQEHAQDGPLTAIVAESLVKSSLAIAIGCNDHSCRVALFQQVLDHVVVTIARSKAQQCHSRSCDCMNIGPAQFHQVLDHVQVVIAARTMQSRHSIATLSLDTDPMFDEVPNNLEMAIVRCSVQDCFAGFRGAIGSR
jgi:hypothetical protein